MQEMADAIHTNSTGSGANGENTSSLSPAIVAIMGILGTALLLVSYYAMVAKCCGRRATQGGAMRRGWRVVGRQRREALQQEEAQQVQEQGLEQADIDAIPVVSLLKRGRSRKRSCGGDGGGPLDCAVCLNEFEEAERVRLLPGCCHAFHLHCIDEWLRSHTTCPLCRTPILFAAAAAAEYPRSPSDLSGHTLALLLAPPASSSPLSPRSDSTPQRRSPISGMGATGVSSCTCEKRAEAHERGLEFSGKAAPLTMRSPTMFLSARLQQCLLHHHDDREARSAPTRSAFTRCFSYAGGSRSSTRSIGTLAASPVTPTSTTLPSANKLAAAHGIQPVSMMQRSSSYSVGSSLPFTGYKWQSPAVLPERLGAQTSMTAKFCGCFSKATLLVPPHNSVSSPKACSSSASPVCRMHPTHQRQHLSENCTHRMPPSTIIPSADVRDKRPL